MDTQTVFRIDGKLYNVYTHILMKRSPYFRAILEDNYEIIDLRYIDEVSDKIWIDFFNMVHNDTIEYNNKNYYTLYKMSIYFQISTIDTQLQYFIQVIKNNVNIVKAAFLSR